MIEDNLVEREPMLSFGPFRLLPGRQMLLEGGEPRSVGSRALEVLQVLAERGGELVTKDELIARVWPKIFVDEATLRVHISALRKVLGEGQLGTRYIVNVQGRGYRFVAPVTVEHEEAEALPARRAPSIADAMAEPGNRVTPAYDLPTQVTRVVGRGEIVRRLAEMLPQRRFLTIVGPGGIGKTTVALAIAETLAPTYRDRALFVDLAPLVNADLVPSALASALGLEVLSHDQIPNLLSFLQDRQILIVFDNCEHVVGAVAALTDEISRAAPDVHILATSREPLRVTGEWVHRLPALDAPPAGDLTAAEALTYASVHLFVERAQSNLESFMLTDADAPVVGDICRWLDGIPLAIELAAARVDVFGIRGLASRLDDQLSVLTRGRRTAMPRHRTLRATLDWSYEALPADERAVLNRLSLFKGAFTLKAASALAGCAVINEFAVLEAVESLAAKSLIAVDTSRRFARFRLLAFTRCYAAEKLGLSGEAEPFARRHALLMCSQLEQAEIERPSQTKNEWLAAQRRHVDDIRSALEWAGSATGDSVIGARLAAASATLWFHLSLMDEFRILAERCLESLHGGPNASLEMELATGLGHALWHTSGPGVEMAAAFGTALDIAERLGNVEFQRRAIWGLWSERATSADYPAAVALTEKYRRLVGDDAPALLVSHRMQALCLHYTGEHAMATDLLRDVLAQSSAGRWSERTGGLQIDQRVATRTLLSRLLWIQGYPDQALQETRENIEDALSLDHSLSLCYALTVGACPISFWVGDLGAAERFVTLLLDHSTKHSLEFWRSWGLVFTQALASEPPHEAGFDLLQLESFSTLTDRWFDPKISRRIEAGDGSWCLPEVRRVEGAALLAADAPDAAAALFEQSMDLARRQGALSWELRAATSLAELRHRQGRGAEAHDLLAAVYRRFAEGFETADLLKAKRLISRLKG